MKTMAKSKEFMQDRTPTFLSEFSPALIVVGVMAVFGFGGPMLVSLFG